MLITTRVINGDGRELDITNPRFNIDDIRKIKTFIRRNTTNITTDGKEKHDLNTIMKFGRCVSYKSYKGMLYSMVVRVSGKESDTWYEIEPIYNEGNISLNINCK